MTRYIVHTRASIKTIYPTHSHVIISVRTPGSEEIAFADNPHRQGVLHLAFDDYDKHPVQSIPILLLRRLAEFEQPDEVILFDAAMADLILAFCRQFDQVDVIYVHCDAGVSRSPAIAAALQKISGDDDSYWFDMKRPNMLVYRTLLDRAFLDC